MDEKVGFAHQTFLSVPLKILVPYVHKFKASMGFTLQIRSED